MFIVEQRDPRTGEWSTRRECRTQHAAEVFVSEHTYAGFPDRFRITVVPAKSARNPPRKVRCPRDVHMQWRLADSASNFKTLKEYADFLKAHGRLSLKTSPASRTRRETNE